MFAALLISTSLMGQPPTPYPVGPPRPPGLAPALPDQLFLTYMPGPSAEDLRIQAAMDRYGMDVNAGMNRYRGPGNPFPTVMLRRDVPVGWYLVGRMKTTTPIPLHFVPYLGQSPTFR